MTLLQMAFSAFITGDKVVAARCLRKLPHTDIVEFEKMVAFYNVKSLPYEIQKARTIFVNPNKDSEPVWENREFVLAYV